MKNKLILLTLLAATAVNAQDVIVKKDGSTIISKVLEVSASEIKYKKYSNQNGPLYSIAVSDVLRINYENNETELFDNSKINGESKSAVSGVEDGNSGQKYTLSPGTLIPIQNVNYIRAAHLSKGQKVQFRVARDVEINGMKIIPYGSSVTGNVYQAKKSAWFGTKGKLGINISEIVLPSGVKIPLSKGDIYVTGRNRTALSVLLFFFVTWPACFITGSKAELPAGYEIVAEVACPVEFVKKDGILEGRIIDNGSSYTASMDSIVPKKVINSVVPPKVIMRRKDGVKVRAVDVTYDERYYYYKLQSKPDGRQYKIKKWLIKEIQPSD